MSEKKLCRWRNLSGTYDYPGGKVGPGEEFLAYSVPDCFRDVIELLEEGVEDLPTRGAKKPPSFSRLKRKIKPSEDESKPKRSFVIRSRSTKGWWDVIDESTGKVINQHALRQAVAEELAKELNDGSSE